MERALKVVLKNANASFALLADPSTGRLDGL
jgi:hypothetical protein